MGTFRSLLALAVVLFHSGGIFGYDITGGIVAVQSFYIISGFYMSFILSEKYASEKASFYLFFTNRLFRLMPVYYFFLFIKVSLAILSVKYDWYIVQGYTLLNFIKYYSMMDTTTIGFLFFTNIFVIGQDICIFLSLNLNNGMLYFSKFEWLTQPSVWYFNFIPQAWTLSLELYFYAVAPFIVRRKAKLIAFIILLSFVLRFLLYFNGYNQNWWAYTFFPTEIAFFLLGSLSYRLFLLLKTQIHSDSKVPFLVWSIVIIVTFFFPLLPKTNSIPFFLGDNKLIFYTTVTIGLPFLFLFSKNSSIDRFIGELSYPMYLSHLIIIPFFGYPLSPNMPMVHIISIIILTVIISYISYICIMKPVDRYRQARIENTGIGKTQRA